jgi:hypothetical protein
MKESEDVIDLGKRVMLSASLLRVHARDYERTPRRGGLDTADHGYKVLKKSRTGAEDVFVEMARVVREWASKLR